MSKWTGSYRCLGLPLFIPSAFWPVKDRALQRPCWSSLGNGLSADTEATVAPAREIPDGPVGRTQRFHWGCPGFHPWSGNQDPACHTAQSKIIIITVSTQKECPVCTEHHCFMKYFKTTEKPWKLQNTYPTTPTLTTGLICRRFFWCRPLKCLLNFLRYCLLFALLLCFVFAWRHVGPQLPNQESNPLHWKVKS